MAIFDRMIEADGVVYASPLFCWGFTSQIKALIDRHFCLVTDAGTDKWKSLVDGKKVGLVMTAAGPMEGNADLLVHQFDSLAAYCKAPVAGRLTVPLCTTPDAIGDDVKQKAVDFVKELTE